MNRLAAAAIALVLIAGSASAATLQGSWTASLRDNGKVQLSISYGRSQNSHSYALTDFATLSESLMRATTATPLQFALRREAGTLAFDGTFKNGFGGGQFTFTPNAAYYDTLRSMGVSLETTKRHREDNDETLLSLALLDVSTEYIRSIRAEGYDVDLDEFIAMRVFNITPALIRELRALGFKKLDADDLVASQVHGVTPDYVRQMRAAGGTDLTMDDLVASRIHRATPEFLAEMKSLGYDLTPDQAVAFRIHGVTARFIRELRDAGYENIPADKLVAMRIHRVDADFAKKMNAKRK